MAVLYHTNAQAAAALEASLPGCIALQCDVASRAACESAFTAAEIMLGHVDVLVCNAGIAQQKLFTDITPAEWQHMLDVNPDRRVPSVPAGPARDDPPQMGAHPDGEQHVGPDRRQLRGPLFGGQAGLIGLTKALAREEGPSGITVNCVAPGVIDTDMMAAFTPGDKAALAEETPVGRLGNAQEVARALLFLAGEEAGYITGQVFG